MTTRLVLDAGPLEWALAAAALGAAVLLARFRLPSGGPRLAVRALRCAALLLLSAALLRPSLDLVEDRSSKPRLAVLIDTGPGMASLDGLGASRLARAVRWVESRRASLERKCQVSLFAVSSGARPVSFGELKGLKPGPACFDAAGAVGDVLDSGPRPERALLLSDGAFDPSPPEDAALSRLGAPLDAAGVGPRKERAAVSFGVLEAPDFTFLHGRFPVSASLEAFALEGRRLGVRLSKGGRVVAERSFGVSKPYEVFQASFSASADSLGRETYRIEAFLPKGPPLAGRELSVEVIRQKYRIMYLAGRPSFEYSHLREHLRSDPNHELVSFVILRNPENVSPVPDRELSLIPFPADEIFVRNLFQFDLFILENFSYTRFQLPQAYLQNLRRFVAEGGALLVIGGSNAFTRGGYQGTALEETLPVALWPGPDDFRPGLFQADAGEATHPMLDLAGTPEASAELWRRLPPLDGWTLVSSVKPGAGVLLRHPSQKTASGEPLPIVALREFGRGKVLFVGTDSTWRWKLGAGRDWKLAGFYPRFWNRAVEYLTGSLDLKKVKFSPLPERMPPREPAVVGWRVFDEHFQPLASRELEMRVQWTPPGGPTSGAAYLDRGGGLYQVELSGLKEGTHKLRVFARRRGEPWGEDETRFRWERPKGEVPMDRRRLKAMAEGTGGRYADLDGMDPEAWLSDVRPARRERRVRGRRALWDCPHWLWGFFAVLMTQWLLASLAPADGRRRGGEPSRR